MEAAIQHDEAVMQFRNKLMEENEDAFETDMDNILLAMEIEFQCIDIGLKEGWLVLEEFALNSYKRTEIAGQSPDKIKISENVTG